MIVEKYFIVTILVSRRFSFTLSQDDLLVNVTDTSYQSYQSYEEVELDDEMKKLYERAHSVDQRGQLYGTDIVDIYFRFFHELEMEIRKNYQQILASNSLKEDIVKRFAKNLDKYVDLEAKHEMFRKRRKDFWKKLNREEQLTFFQNFLQARNFTKMHRVDD